jgi:hypothetical protein
MKQLHLDCKVILAVLVVACQQQASAASWDKVSLNGYFSFEYEKTISGDDEEDVNGSFDLDLVDLVINVDLTDKLRLAVDLTWEHGTASEDDRGNVAVEYGFAEYTIHNLLRLKAGKMFTHFGIYNEIHTAKPANLTIKEPLSTNKNDKFGNDIRFYPRWVNGIGATGDGEVGDWEFDYDLQLSNGESEDDDANPFEEDDNTRKAVNGRIRVTPGEGIRVGVSFYDDSMNDPDNNGERFDISSYGVQFEWDTYDNIGVEAEYIFGTVDMTVATGSEIERSGLTLMVFYHLTDRWIPYLRYESLDPNDDIDDDEATKTVAGINWMVEQNMYLKFEVDRVNTQDNNGEFSGADFTEFKASLSIGF